MEVNPPRTQTQIIRKLFGQIVISKGFSTEADVQKALEIQREQDRTRGSHQLIGLIMLQEGAFTNAQLIEVLQYLDKMEKPREREA